MCIVYHHRNPSKNIKLLVASNRDEFFDRTSLDIHKWNSGIIAGKDQKNNGTWLGFTKYGDFSFITNYRTLNQKKELTTSRGHLVKSYLEDGIVLDESKFDNYKPFNLVFGNVDSAYFITNQRKGKTELPNVFTISNGPLNSNWAKVKRLETKMNKINFSNDLESLKREIFQVLSNKIIKVSDKLPQTGLSEEHERLLSAIFISTPKYGTVSQNISIVDSDNVLHMYEKNVLSKSEQYVQVQLEMK